ncbi:MAG: right-handed parallel beta-helix repeat-containing protein, partial [Desulfotomaculaceae bacterium]
LGVGPSVFSNSSGILYEDNNLLSGVQISNSSNVDILNNTITPTDRHGIQLKGNVSNIVVSDNDIKVATKYDCIRDESVGSVSIGSNTCQ